MKIFKHPERLTTLATVALLSLLSAPSVHAGPLAISDVPLFLTTGVKPNLIMAIDDSGSMDFEVLLPGNDGSAWWRIGASGNCTALLDNNSFTGCVADGSTDQVGTGRLNFNNSGNPGSGWKKFAYLFPNGLGNNDENRRRLGDSTNDHYAIPPLGAFAWSRSPEHNRAYFDPEVTYTPWLDSPGFTFGNADPAAARWDPVFTGQAAINLKQDFAGTYSYDTTANCSNTDLGGSTAIPDHYYFRVYTGMVIPAGTCMRLAGRNWEKVRAASVCAVGVNNACLVTSSTGVNQQYTMATGSRVAFRYFPATFYLSTATAPASFGYTATPVADGLAPNGTVMYRYEIKPANFSSTALYDAAIQNFANWFSYYRKRHQALRAGLGSAFDGLTATRVAGFTINSVSGSPPTGPNVTMDDIDVTANRTALYTNFYRDWVNSGGTPNRAAVANIIRNYKRTGAGAPITRSCQRNFGMLFTDGFSNPPAAGDGINGIAGNADGTAGAPYQDNTTDTLADAVYKAYNEPLRTGVGFPAGKVIPQKGCDQTPVDPRLDCKTDLHMNFYAITLGTRGLQFNPDADPPQDPYTTTYTWPTTFPARHPSAVDDLWHATINGRGQLLNAASSTELADKLRQVLRSIAEDKGTASSAAVNSGSISSDTRLFQAAFDGSDWSGRLFARSVAEEDDEAGTEEGTLGAEVDATVPAPNSREIVTVDADGNPVAFTWGTIGATRQTELNGEDVSGSEYGEQRLAWLRGDDAHEAVSPYNFRRRTTTDAGVRLILGDMVNSAPAYVGAPPFRYPDTLESAPYSTFRAAHQDRTHMVYVGGNDGMLHAFSSDDENTGAIVEEFAFIPSAVFKNLHHLTSPTYSHRYYVDGSPVTGDAFVGGEWRTILLGSLNNGGQEIFALDVTDPANLTESNAASVVKWEFTDANDVELGNTYSRPSIVRTNAGGVWAAGFGNGYNSTLPDGRASTTGNAVLFMLDLDDGSVLTKIDTGVGASADPLGQSRPNGLSTPVFVDIDGDNDVDYAYAGDLFGNLWKFDLTSSDPDAWSVSYGAPLFVARDASNNRQPITSRPNVSRGPKGVGLVVLFGTGKYLESQDTDTSLVRPQSFYGLLDPMTGAGTDTIAGRANLTQQTITHEVLGASFPPNLVDVRVTSANPLGGTSRGWYIDLVSPSGYQGEMQVTDSLIRNDHVTFTTLVPNSDPCENGGRSWLMELNLFTGGRPVTTPWDLNDDGIFEDVITIGGVDYPISGIGTKVGITPKPAALAGEKCDWLIFPGTSGGTESRCRNPGPRGFGRQSWRQAH